MNEKIMKTIDKVNAELAADKITIRRWRSKRKYAAANYVAVLNGDQNIGHYSTIADAAAEARETAKGRNP